MQSLLLDKNPLFGLNPDGKGIYFFTLPIQFYAIFIVTGMILAAIFSALLMKRRNMDNGFIYILFVVCIPSAIIGARLFSCLTDPGLGIKAFFDFPWAGLSITGGVIGGVLSGFIVCMCCKVNFLRAADCVVINILFAQAIGRWGNYFNREVYGRLVTDPAQQWFPWAVYIEESGEWHHAFFFYEMVINLIGWAILFTFTWFRKKKPNGISTCLYFVWYGTVRAIMEPLRDPSFILNAGGVMWSELFAIMLSGFGVIAILVLLLVNYKREDAFIGSRKGDPCGITKFLSYSKKVQPYFSKINMLGANYPPRPVTPKKKKKGGMSEDEVQDPPSEGEKDESMERPRPASLDIKDHDREEKK